MKDALPPREWGGVRFPCLLPDEPCAWCMATLPVRRLEVSLRRSILVAGEGKGVSEMKRILAALFSQPDRRALEQAYLNQAVSLYDLEQREREIAHGLFAGR